MKKYLAKEEDKEKVDYDAIIRPAEPIRNFQDIAKKTAALALLEKKESNDNDAESEDGPSLEAAMRRGERKSTERGQEDEGLVRGALPCRLKDCAILGRF